jgi:hypothetical protein
MFADKGPTRNSRAAWTAEEDRRLLQLRASGRSIVSISAALGTASTVAARLSIVRKREAMTPQELKPMATFDPSEPAVLHDCVTDQIETWTGEDAADYRNNAISKQDGTVNGWHFVFDGWGNVLGG